MPVKLDKVRTFPMFLSAFQIKPSPVQSSPVPEKKNSALSQMDNLVPI